jgi:nitrite reductase (NADH) small subunit
MSNNWIEIGILEDIPQKGARVVQTSKGNIAVFRTAQDKVFAMRDQCPHKGGPLSQGIVYDNTVACPLHNWRISLDNGEAQAPDEGRTSCFPVMVEDGVVLLGL